MKRINHSIICLLLLLLTAAVTVKGQPGKLYPSEEKVNLFTDRMLYIAGEEVHFSAFLSSYDRQQSQLSLILYAELISPDGKSVAGSKFALVNNASEGCLTIPKDIISGVYYLRTYTKYMRNLGPEAYSYAGIKIVNPLRTDVMIGKDTSGFEKKPVNAANTADTKTITIGKNEFAPRQRVNVSIKAPGTALSEQLCISVIPEATSSENTLQLPVIQHQVTAMRYYPETGGVSVTGVVKDNRSGNALANTRINLSIIGHGRDFMAMQTDSAGRYFFSLPNYNGYRDLFLCAENTADMHPKILVDNDFCAVPVHMPSPVFKLTADERAVAYQMAMNTRLEQVFAPDTIPFSNDEEKADVAFYGTPTDIVSIDNYVQLPTLEEYFNELPTLVKVRKRHGEKYFKVFGTQAEMAIFDPLVMVDWVAINDPEKILAVSPQSIARIEVLNVPYVKGDITYGGILSIISKRGDFAGIDLPASGIFLNYLFVSDQQICEVNSVVSPNIPDARNTLYWDPNLKLDAGNNANFSFTTPDTPGHYTIVLKGKTTDGGIFTRTKEFEVKQAN